MKKIILAFAALFVIFSCAQVIAEEAKKENIPAGMELKEIDGRKLYVPKDMNFTRKGDLIVLESANDYVARKLAAMEEHVANLEAKIEKLNEKVLELEKALVVQKNSRP